MVQYGFDVENITTRQIIFSYSGGSFSDFMDELYYPNSMMFSGDEPESGSGHVVGGIILAVIAIICSILTGDPFCGNRQPKPDPDRK